MPNIHNGDIIIVDKSNRSPLLHRKCLCVSLLPGNPSD